MSEKEKNYLWAHFEFNAEQRLKTFNFFVVLAVFANGGVFASIEKQMHPIVLVLIGAFICWLVLIFWVMDKRSKHLLSLAVPGLKDYEKKFPAHSQLFERDVRERNSLIRYTFAFAALFTIQLIFGAGVMAFGIITWICPRFFG
jgi:hypothetical protein